MPLKLFKTNIEVAIDNPEDGYMLLGFDEFGTLVSKDSEGNYNPIVTLIENGVYSDLQTSRLTIGSRKDNLLNGTNSISQGTNIISSGISSFASGLNSIATGDFSFSFGINVEATKSYSYVFGFSNSISTLKSSGINSFVHSNATTGNRGAFADFSVIIGGTNHTINTNADYSVIIGGSNVTINSGVKNTTVIGGDNFIATQSNTVYTRRLNLRDTTSLSIPENGTIMWDGTNFKGMKNNNLINLDDVFLHTINQAGVSLLTESMTSLDIVFDLLYPVSAYITRDSGSFDLRMIQNSIPNLLYTSSVDLYGLNLLPGRYFIDGGGPFGNLNFVVTGVYGKNVINSSLINVIP